MPGSSSDFFFSLGFQEEGHFCGQGVVGDGAECGDAEHASSDERTEELHGSAANHNKVLREFFLTVLICFSELWGGGGGASDPEGEGESAA